MDKTLVFEDRTLAQGFTQIPNAILRCPALSAGSRLLYAILLSYAWQDGECFPGQERLADDLGFKSTRGIRKLLVELKDVGLIQVIRRGRTRTNLYVITSWSKLGNILSDRNCGSYHSEVTGTTVPVTQSDRNCGSSRDRNGSSDYEYSGDKQTVYDGQRNSNAAAVLSDEQEGVLSRLLEIGMDRVVAEKVVQQHDLGAVHAWVAEAEAAEGLNNPAGFGLSRLRGGKEPPRSRADNRSDDDLDRYVGGEYAEFVEH